MAKTIRQVARQKAIICVYQNLIVDASWTDMKNYIKADDQLIEGARAYEFCIQLIENVLKNKDNYIQVIEKQLKKGWSFNRLNKMEAAILLVSTSELLDSDLDKSIVINEAVINAKEYCDEDSYKFINGVLNDIV
ncbi:transcription antitermination factor NusB [Eggerthia catenaformis OT 569 = DSM 20559]|uniref:Transcription antitermination factor NusB n=1 Tax=Eggerthia catenaformis OT 569 = DSM 20559 TaxID=999415 RepID=M2Q276_9FIRM|nr:transcription antitermination factor NusB [Eggerthia catenaformis]EMD16995.1 transcription antitermination factor NusB [Eggerthia catenaformis OT 569 = DSM 20559]OUC51903.1 transcription antitermination factor NusB [Eggerthia catenaformis]